MRVTVRVTLPILPDMRLAVEADDTADDEFDQQGAENQCAQTGDGR